MHTNHTLVARTFLFIALTAICPKPGMAQPPLSGGLKLLGKYNVPYNLAYAGTTVGGLSGIDYDPNTNRYYLISDDRSNINPARFYTAIIQIGPKGIDTVAFTKTTTFKQHNGTVTPTANKTLAIRLTPRPSVLTPWPNTWYGAAKVSGYYKKGTPC